MEHMVLQEMVVALEAVEAVEAAHPRLSEKLSDLAKVLALFHSLHDGKYRDSGADMLVMAKKLFEHPDQDRAVRARGAL